MTDPSNVRPYQKPERPGPRDVPSTAGRNPRPGELDISERVAPPAPIEPDDDGIARTDRANDFDGYDQNDVRLRGWSEALWKGPSGDIDELDCSDAGYSVFKIRLDASKSFSLTDPPDPHYTEDETPLRRGYGLTVYVYYAGAYTPTFSGVTWEDGELPDWTAESGKVDVVVLTYIDGAWFGFVGGLNYTKSY